MKCQKQSKVQLLAGVYSNVLAVVALQRAFLIYFLPLMGSETIRSQAQPIHSSWDLSSYLVQGRTSKSQLQPEPGMVKQQ